MSAAKISLVLLLVVVAGEATVLPLIKAIFGKDSNNLETSDYYTRDDCIYPNGYYYSGHNGYPSGYYGYPSGYYEYNGYDREYYTGHNGYPRRYYAGHTGYPRGYIGYKEYYPRVYYSGYHDIYHRADTPRQGKSWSELCKVHYPDSSGAPGKAGVVCL